MQLSGKVALITGAARGIGNMTAELFKAEGATVISADITPSTLEDSIGLDVTKEKDWSRAADYMEKRFGRVDVLVNNAGILTYSSVHDCSLEEWSNVVAVNQTGVFLGMRAIIPLMRRSGGGSIVNISSTFGLRSVSGAHAYHATKAAVTNMSKNAAVTYAEEGIRVNSVHPNLTDTPMIKANDPSLNDFLEAATPMKRKGKPEEIAKGILFLASDASSYITGSELVIDGGYLAQ
jgi:NAD(P)-dependent dehydrogenase (short-subunit alcohol dehydrogenase family)